MIVGHVVSKFIESSISGIRIPEWISLSFQHAGKLTWKNFCTLGVPNQAHLDLQAILPNLFSGVTLSPFQTTCVQYLQTIIVCGNHLGFVLVVFRLVAPMFGANTASFLVKLKTIPRKCSLSQPVDRV